MRTRRPYLRIGLAALVICIGLYVRVDGPGAADLTAAPPPTVAGAHFRLDPAAAEGAGAQPLSAAARHAALKFGPDVAPEDREAILAAIAAARPEARALIGLVDGITTVRVGPTGRAVGSATDIPGHYEVVLDLATVSARNGPRGIRRVVLHELAHVVDFALVTDELMARFDTATPAGFGCDAGLAGGCAATEERFAESFAKWATDDIGVDLHVGYKVPPPSPAWGALVPLIGG